MKDNFDIEVAYVFDYVQGWTYDNSYGYACDESNELFLIQFPINSTCQMIKIQDTAIFCKSYLGENLHLFKILGYQKKFVPFNSVVVPETPRKSVFTMNIVIFLH